MKISNCIWHYYRKHYKIQRKGQNLHEITFFETMPSSLKASLHKAVYMPILQEFVLFELHAAKDEMSLLFVCREGLSEANYFPGQEIFCAGETGIHMYFLRTVAPATIA